MTHFRNIVVKKPAIAIGLAVTLALSTVACASGLTPVAIDGKLAPESMSATSKGVLYASSIATGILYRAQPGEAAATAWTAKQTEGPGAITGVFADERSGLVWACFTDMAAFQAKSWQPGVARSFEMATGALRASYTLPEGSFCNDFTSAKDGTIYITETFGSRVLRLAPGAAALEVFLSAPELKGVNGLALSGDEAALYVTNEMQNKLFRIDIDAGKSAGLTELKLSQPVLSPDGMRMGDDGLLYLAENGLTVKGAGRVDAIKVDGKMAIVTPIATTLDTPTAVSKVGGTLWVLELKLAHLVTRTDPGTAHMVPLPLSN